MKKSKLVSARAVSCGTAYQVTTRVYHPFSYYVENGADLDDSHTRDLAGLMYDDPEDIDAGLPADGLCDPHIGFDDMVEELGVIRAKNLEAAAGVPSPGNDSESQ